MSSLKNQIKSGNSRIFRRAFIKRRTLTDGLFEPEWQDITIDVKRWGKISTKVDAQKINRFRFSTLNMTVANDRGKFNPETDSNSLWSGFANRQRSLLKIEAGFEHLTISAGGVHTLTEFPSQTTQYVGLIQGDMLLSDKNEVILNGRPLTQVFRDYPASALNGYTNSLTAEKFMLMVRDHTDGSGNFVFRTFFGETTTGWDIDSTTSIYSELNTQTAQDVRDNDVWNIIDRLAQAEFMIPYVSKTGVFKFKNVAPTATVSFSFFGGQTFDTEFGQTIKKVQSFGFKVNDYFSRVRLKFAPEDTITSFLTVESAFSVGGTNNPWNLGHKTLDLENNWIPDTATASVIATNVFNNVSSLKNELKFITTFVPQLDVQDRVSVTYNTRRISEASTLWDLNKWAGDGSDPDDLIWDGSLGDAIDLDGQEFRFLSVKIDLDKLETSYIAKEV